MSIGYKRVISLIIFITLLLGLTVVGFTNCPSNADFEDAIRSAIVNYFRTHSEEDLNVLKDLIEFYSTHDLSTADCSEVGKNSGVEIQEAYKDTGNVSEAVEGLEEDEKSVSLIEEVFSWVDDLLHSEWISNSIIGITLHSWSSDDFQFPIGSNNLWGGGGMRFAVRYNGNLKWSHDGWIGSNIQTLPVTEDLHFTENTNDKKVAVGKVADSNIEVKTEATLLKDKKWMLIKYTMINKGNSAINNVKFYQGADFDVDHVTYSNDYGGYDSNLKLLYEWDSDGYPYVGFASSLSPAKHDVTQFRKIWDRISSDTLGDSNSYGIGDVGVAFRWDFGTLYPGETKEIPIILGAGTSLSDLKNEIKNGLGYVAPAQEPKLKILAIPILWRTINNDEFQNSFNKSLDIFLKQLNLNICRDKISIEWVDVSQSFSNFDCCSSWWCKNFGDVCQIDKVTEYATKLGKNPKDFNFVIGMIDQNSFLSTVCENDGIDGCRSGKTVWFNEQYKVALAHEVGHVFNLEDEWCSNPAGSDDCRCNDGGIKFQSCEKDINYLDPELGCNASEGGDCCETEDYDGDGNVDLCRDYELCCEGNVYSEHGRSGRSIMSYSNAPEPRGFNSPSLDYLNTKDELRCD